MYKNNEARKVINDIQKHVDRMVRRLDVAETMNIDHIDNRTPAFDSFREDVKNIKTLADYFEYELTHMDD